MEVDFDTLVREYTPRIFNFVLRLSGSRDAAEDLTQETFVKAWKNVKNFEAGSRIEPWLFTIARNVTTDYLRKKKALPFSTIYDDAGAHIPDDTTSIEEELSREDNARVVTDALLTLPPIAREVLLMRYQEGLTFEEIAEALSLSINTVKSRGRRALLALREALATMHQNL